MRHAEVRIGDTVVMLSDGAGDWPLVPAHVHVYAEDVDATFKFVLEAGVIAAQEPVKQDDPNKRWSRWRYNMVDRHEGE